MDAKDKKFIEYYSGLKRSYGSADMDKAKIHESGKLKIPYSWKFEELTEEDYIKHLNGEKAIGVQPCDDEGKACFGAIDIDDKQHSYKNFPYKKYLDLIAEYKLPVIPIKSKSGGLHLSVYFKEKVSALFVRNFFDKILLCLGLPPNIEIYPKETQLGEDENGKKEVGHFINLPYFGKKERFALNLDGTTFTFDQFIQVVEANLQTEESINSFTKDHVKQILMGGDEEFEDGPPCLQALTKDKLHDGRDRFLYNYMVFAKKKYPDNWEEQVLEGARKYIVYDKVWGDLKVKEKLKAWKKDTKGHTCSEDPICNFCIKSECIKRPYGILSDKKKRYPKLSGLQKYAYPIPEYSFNVEKKDGTVVSCRAKDISFITNQEKLRNLIGDAAGFVPPRVKELEFQDTVLDPLFDTQNKEVIKPPKSATPEGILEQLIQDWIDGPEAKNDTSFRSGSVLFEDKYLYFKFTPFYNEAKNKEWKESRLKTTEMMTNLFKAEHDISKRFPKKEGKTNNPIPVVKISRTFFDKTESNKKIVPMVSRKEIM